MLRGIHGREFVSISNLRRVLIADDEREFRLSLAKTFRKEGFQVSAAGDGKQAEEFLNHEYYPLVVLDLKMPGKDGLELLREIKSKTPATQVIIVTVFDDTATCQQALLVGAFACLKKPVKREAILETARRALEPSASTPAA